MNIARIVAAACLVVLAPFGPAHAEEAATEAPTMSFGTPSKRSSSWASSSSVAGRWMVIGTSTTRWTPGANEKGSLTP